MKLIMLPSAQMAKAFGMKLRDTKSFKIFNDPSSISRSIRFHEFTQKFLMGRLCVCDVCKKKQNSVKSLTVNKASISLQKVQAESTSRAEL